MQKPPPFSNISQGRKDRKCACGHSVLNQHDPLGNCMVCKAECSKKEASK